MSESASSQYVDVRIYSTTGTDLLANYQYKFQITPDASNPDVGALDFNAVNNVYNAAYQNEPPGYVFSAANTGYVLGSPVGNVTNGAHPPNDLFTSADTSSDPSTLNFVNVQVGDSLHPSLLARLLLVPEAGTNAPHQGDKFIITLLASDPFTVFQYADSQNNLHDVTASGIAGTVTIGPPVQPTPEPDTMALLSAGGFLLFAGRALGRTRAR
jgi:hypothetical protein